MDCLNRPNLTLAKESNSRPTGRGITNPCTNTLQEITTMHIGLQVLKIKKLGHEFFVHCL